MSFDSLLMLATKVLGCAVVIYILAGFLVSLSRLLPFLAIASSVGTLLAISHIQKTGAQELLWMPIVLSLLTQIFYQGERYMNPRVHENLYELVNVERKWNSLFADFDDYELHFSPVETGGFIENTLFLGILFGLYYSAFMFSEGFGEAAYILPIYFLAMSVVDLLMVFGFLRLSPFFYGALRVLICILAVAAAFLLPTGKESGTVGNTVDKKQLYEDCAPLVKLDYSISYRVSYELSTISNYEYRHYDGKNFVYDATLDVGAEYDTVSAGVMYDKVFVINENYDNKITQLSNAGGLDFDFKYVRCVEKVGGPFKYTTVSCPDFAPYCELTEHKLNHLGSPIEKDKENNTLEIVYTSQLDSTFNPETDEKYQVIWLFHTDSDGTPVSLASVTCNLYINEANREQLIYRPIRGSTGLENLFEEDGSLKGYTYNENEIAGIDLKNVFDALNGQNGTVANYDFKVVETRNGASTMYIYDTETGIVALFSENYENGDNAARTNDFVTYPPDCYISNQAHAKYDADYQLVGTRLGSTFKRYTFDNGSASRAIQQAFDGIFIFTDVSVYQGPDGSFFDITITEHNEDLYVDVVYTLFIQRYMNSDDYYLTQINASFTYEEAEYLIKINLSGDWYDVPAPPANAQ